MSACLYSLSDVHVTLIARIAALTCNECAITSKHASKVRSWHALHMSWCIVEIAECFAMLHIPKQLVGSQVLTCMSAPAFWESGHSKLQACRIPCQSLFLLLCYGTTQSLQDCHCNQLLCLHKHMGFVLAGRICKHGKTRRGLASICRNKTESSCKRWA